VCILVLTYLICLSLLIYIFKGSGDNRQEFECYKIALSFACPYFDGKILYCYDYIYSTNDTNSLLCLCLLKYATAMLSTNMTENNESRIEFPDKDPTDQWKVFYPFIDPSKIGMATHSAIINDKNVMTIVPWFHEFSMESHLAQCDQFLSEKVVSISNIKKVDHGHWKETVLTSFWDDANFAKRKERTEIVKQIVQLLEFSCIYDLQKTKDETENTIQTFLDWDNLFKTNHLFDIPAVKVLTTLFLPLAQEEDDGYKYFVSKGKSQVLRNWLDDGEFQQNKLDGLSLEEVNSSPMLPILIKTQIDLWAEQSESSNITNSARGLVRDLLDNAPNELYNNMSHTADRNTAGRTCLMGILKKASSKHKEAFKKLHVTLPQEYNQV